MLDLAILEVKRFCQTLKEKTMHKQYIRNNATRSNTRQDLIQRINIAFAEVYQNQREISRHVSFLLFNKTSTNLYNYFI